MRFVAMLLLSLVAHCSTRPVKKTDFENIINESLEQLKHMVADKKMRLHTPTNVHETSLASDHLEEFISALKNITIEDTDLIKIRENLTNLRGSCNILMKSTSRDAAQPQKHKKPLSHFIKELTEFLRMLNQNCDI